MRITAIDGFTARCEARGEQRDTSLWMMQSEPPAVGDYVVIQGGYAVRRVDAEEAHAAWALFDQILGELDGG